MTYFVDSNIFLEVELKDEKREECQNFLTRVAQGTEDCMISDFILYSVLIELVEKSTLDMANNFLKFFEQANIEVFVPNMRTLSEALNIVKKYNLDFDDALVVSSMLENKINKLISFDRHFDRVKEIKRFEPNQL